MGPLGKAAVWRELVSAHGIGLLGRQAMMTHLEAGDLVRVVHSRVRKDAACACVDVPQPDRHVLRRREHLVGAHEPHRRDRRRVAPDGPTARAFFAYT